jgi:dolichol-phosphate mannosyltransferase
MGGTQMVMLGVVGEYLWRTLAQARNRDHYIIDQIYGDSLQQNRCQAHP